MIWGMDSLRELFTTTLNTKVQSRGHLGFFSKV